MTRSRGRTGAGCAAAVAAALLAVGAMSPAHAAEVDWNVGLARAKITPERPIWMAGYAARKKPSEGVLAELYAKAMAFEDADGHRAVLITADVIGFRRSVADLVCRQVAEKTGLKRHQILLCPSHTHTGPVLTFQDEPVYSMPPEELKRVDQHTRKLAGQLAELAAAAVKNLEPARLSWGTGVVHFVMNRREFTDRGVRLGFNPRGYVDRSVPVLRVDGPEGKLRAAVFGCACHNTTLTGHHYVLSGDYAGFAQEHVEKAHPGVQAMFMIGCGGDANPYPRGEIEHAKRNGKELGTEVCRLLAGRLRPVGGPLTVLLENADAPLEPVPSREKLAEMVKGPGYVAFNARKMLAAVDKGESLRASYPVPIAVWQFGDDLTLVGIAGEVTAGYVPLVETALGHRRLWIAGYANEVYGYLVTAKVLAEGGYETRGLYTDVGFFSPKAQEVVIAKIRQMAKKGGRKVPE